jgi:hypothetical protein
MEKKDVEELVSTIVTARFKDFKAHLDLELAPFKLTVQGLEKQLVEVRTANSATASGISRIEGRIEASEEIRDNYHRQNLQAREEDRTIWMNLLSKVESHLGEHIGQDKHEEKTIDGQERKKDNVRKTIVAVASIAGSAGALKWLSQHFHWHF